MTRKPSTKERHSFMVIKISSKMANDPAIPMKLRRVFKMMLTRWRSQPIKYRLRVPANHRVTSNDHFEIPSQRPWLYSGHEK